MFKSSLSLGSPEKDCALKVSISHILLLPVVQLTGNMVQEVLHVLFVFDMEFSHLYAVWCSRVLFQTY